MTDSRDSMATPTLQSVIESYLVRRMSGDALSPESFAAQHGEYGDELLDQLREAELIAAANAGQQPDSLAAAPSPGQLSIRCPHCQMILRLSADTVWAEVHCSHCDGSFSLVSREESDGRAPLSHLAQFELLERIGIGAFGTVWKARDTRLDRLVALKLPRKEQLNEREAAAFFHEAQSAAQIVHPNVVLVYEVGLHDDILYIASEYIAGHTLAHTIQVDRPDPYVATRLVAEIARGLHAAHCAGVVHRDLKPGNILIDECGQPHIADFGLAKYSSKDVLLTLDGVLIGTPAYMSPEQAAGTAGNADARSDIYALGVILFELLTGELPFRGTSTNVLRQVLHDAPPNPRRLNHYVSRDLDTICLKCLEKTPSSRYATAEELAEELERVLRREPIKTRPVGAIGRLIRWSQRRPVVAILAVALLASLLLGSLVSLGLALVAMDRSHQLSDKNERLLGSAYAYDMAEVQRMVAEENSEVALHLLEQHIPTSEKQPDRRGLEWHLWWRTIHDRQIAIHESNQKLKCVEVTPDGTSIVWGNEHGDIFASDASLNSVRQIAPHHDEQVISLQFSSDGKRLYSLSPDATLVVTDFERNRILNRLDHPDRSSWAMRVSPSGNRLALSLEPAAGSSDEQASEIRIWEQDHWESPQRITTIPGTTCLHWSPTESELIVSRDRSKFILSLNNSTPPEPLKSPDAFDGYIGGTSRVLDDGSLVLQVNSPQGWCTLARMNPISGEARIIEEFPEGYAARIKVNEQETMVATPTARGNIHCYDLSTGKKALTLSAHRGRVMSVDFVPCSERLVSASEDGTVRLWDASTQRQAASVNLPLPDYRAAFSKLELSPDGKRLAVETVDGISIRQVPDLTEIQLLSLPGDKPKRGHINGLRFLPDSNGIAIAENRQIPGGARILVYPTLESHDPDTILIQTDGCWPNSLLVTSEKLFVGTGTTPNAFPGGPAAIQVFDRASRQLRESWQPADNIDPWRPHRMHVSNMIISNDGLRLYSVGARDRCFKGWKVGTGQPEFSYRNQEVFGARQLAIRPDDQIVAVGWLNGQITLHDRQGRVSARLMGHRNQLSSLAFASDNRTLVTSSFDGTIRIWDTEVGQSRTTIELEDAVAGILVTPDDDWIISLDARGHLRCWDCRELASGATSAIQGTTRESNLVPGKATR